MGRRKPLKVVLSKGGSLATSFLAPFAAISPCIRVSVESLRRRIPKKANSVSMELEFVARELGTGRGIAAWGRSVEVWEAIRGFEYVHGSSFPASHFVAEVRKATSLLMKVSEAFAVVAYVPHPTIPRIAPPQVCRGSTELPSAEALDAAIPVRVGEVFSYSSGSEVLASAADERFVHVIYVGSMVPRPAAESRMGLGSVVEHE